jgi:ligand-binding sensor domain-containing protein/signal transduction histidine kinase
MWLLVLMGLSVGGECVQAEIDPQSQVLPYHHWGRGDGLPEDTVTALLQTHDGYLWVGTAAGLSRFDGLHFEKQPLDGGEPAGAPAITALCEDASHRLWIGTREAGLYYMSAEGARRFAPEFLGTNQSITSLAADAWFHLWVGTTTKLIRLDVAAPPSVRAPLVLTNDFISSLHAARSGTIWITSRGGMSQYKNGRLTPIELEAENLGRTLEFMGLYEDRTGSLWAFGDTYLVNLSEGKRFNYFRTGDASSLRIWTLCESSSGQLWIGTSGQGLFAFADGKFRPLALRENRLPGDVRAICEDRQGDLWLGTFGGGLVRLRVRQEQVFDSHKGLPDETVACIGVDAGGRLWAGFQSGLFLEAGKRFEPVGSGRLINALALGVDGSVWTGTWGNGLWRLIGGQAVHFGTADGLSSDIVTAVATLPDGGVYAGTSSGAVHLWRGDRMQTFSPGEGAGNSAIEALLVDSGGGVYAGTQDGQVFRGTNNTMAEITGGRLVGAPISALAESSGGQLWIASAGHGVAGESNGVLTTWNAGQGLPDNTIFGLLPETNDILWALTGKGIFRLEMNRPAAARLVVETEPLEHRVGGYPTAVKSNDGKLWFACGNKVVVIDPQKINDDPGTWPIYIERVLVNDSPVPLAAAGHSVVLPPRLSSLEVRFAVLNLAEPEKVRVEHKLDGFDSGWVDGGSERTVRYGRLPYGNYMFHVRAQNADGKWTGPEAAMEFAYAPPAWRSAGALAFYGLTAVAIMVAVVRAMSHRRLRMKLDRVARQQAMDKERMRIAQDMHDEIGSKLTKIAYLSDIAALHQHDPSTTESMNTIAGASRDLLQSLDEIVWAVNPRNDSLERLAAYLGHYATEYLQDTPLELEMDLPSGLPDYPLSAETRHNLFLAFEEILANALKHSGATKVFVAMTLAEGRFTITVRDNGKGFAPGAAGAGGGLGNGLSNMRDRLRDIRGKCMIDSTPGGGTMVTLSIEVAAVKSLA